VNLNFFFELKTIWTCESIVNFPTDFRIHGLLKLSVPLAPRQRCEKH
jgi:hypothetical protein